MQSIMSMLILMSTLVFLIFNLKSIFEQIWAEKVEAFCFAWKLAYRLSRGRWFLLRKYFSEFPTLNPFCLHLSCKSQIPFVLIWNWNTDTRTRTHTHTHIHIHIHIRAHVRTHTHTHTHTQYVEDAGSYFDISFLKFQI